MLEGELLDVLCIPPLPASVQIGDGGLAARVGTCLSGGDPDFSYWFFSSSAYAADLWDRAFSNLKKYKLVRSSWLHACVVCVSVLLPRFMEAAVS